MVGEGRCGEWYDRKWIGTALINGAEDRGEKNVKFRDCVKKCDDRIECSFISWSLVGKQAWCYIWMGECTPKKYNEYKTYKKPTGLLLNSIYSRK